MKNLEVVLDLNMLLNQFETPELTPEAQKWCEDTPTVEKPGKLPKPY